MAITLYRVQKAKRWSGQPEPGFSRVGRWHSGGRAILYLAESPALAVLEWVKSKMSQGLIEKEIGQAELLLIALPLELDAGALPAVVPAVLPEGWERIPNIHCDAAQTLGNRWLDGRSSLALRVPSATLPPGMGWNVLVNPGHPDYPASFSPDRVTATSFSLEYYLGVQTGRS